MATSAIAFQATSPLQPLAPSAFRLEGSISGSPSGTLFVLIAVDNPLVATAGNFLISGDNSGRVDISPALPASLGAGTHRASITVRACLNDRTCSTGEVRGSPATVAVTYTIPSTVQRDSVTPRVIPVQTTANLALRGAGFDNISSVSIGSTPASAFTRISESEIRITTGTLPAGTHAISINGGAIPFTASLVVVNEERYVAEQIAYPEPIDPSFGGAKHILYDAPSKSLFVVVRKSASPIEYRLFRFTHGTGWTHTASIDVTGYTDIRLASDAARIYLIKPTLIQILDPATLGLISTVTRPAVPSGIYELHGIGLANDGLAVVTTSVAGSGSVPVFMFSTTALTFTQVPLTVAEELVPEVSKTGDRVNIDGFTDYIPVTGTFVSAGGFRATSVAPRVFSFSINGSTGGINEISVGQYVSGSITVLGNLPSMTQLVGAAADTFTDRAYTIDITGTLRTWNIGVPPTGGSYSEQSAPFPISGFNSSITNDLNLAVAARSVDGRTGFVAGRFGVAVVPEL